MKLGQTSLAELRAMRDYIGAALSKAEKIDDTLLAALLDDLEHNLSARIGVIVSTDGISPQTDRSPRFSPTRGYGRARSSGNVG